ncbi:hypothetical protein [Methylobacterium sp. Leaf85]|uniref:hypothetical protein n=1 Tax=Methylobacterium sp. Leaf85 TaxID=1736241 RepID=UPI0006F2226C|nr:hypothetical protein [Methylobacterium sp. Leaf85]KQO53156.1 hypothetical protein ASF08_18030 [Methylobacterium sp. Leaf85]
MGGDRFRRGRLTQPLKLCQRSGLFVRTSRELSDQKTLKREYRITRRGGLGPSRHLPKAVWRHEGVELKERTEFTQRPDGDAEVIRGDSGSVGMSKPVHEKASVVLQGPAVLHVRTGKQAFQDLFR